MSSPLQPLTVDELHRLATVAIKENPKVKTSCVCIEVNGGIVYLKDFSTLQTIAWIKR